MKVRWPWQDARSNSVAVDDTLRRAENLADKLTGLVSELEQHLEEHGSEQPA